MSITCKGCGVSLEGVRSVNRKYDGGSRPVYGRGHYDSTGTFEPDEYIVLPDGSQTYDGYDRCVSCFAVVG